MKHDARWFLERTGVPWPPSLGSVFERPQPDLREELDTLVETFAQLTSSVREAWEIIEPLVVLHGNGSGDYHGIRTTQGEAQVVFLDHELGEITATDWNPMLLISTDWTPSHQLLIHRSEAPHSSLEDPIGPAEWTSAIERARGLRSQPYLENVNPLTGERSRASRVGRAVLRRPACVFQWTAGRIFVRPVGQLARETATGVASTLGARTTEVGEGRDSGARRGWWRRLPGGPSRGSG